MTLLSDLVTTLRQRCDVVVSQVVTDAELAGYINSSLAELDDVLVGLHEDYKVTRATATIASSAEGSNYFSLPADFLKSRGVDVQFAGGRWVSLDRFAMTQRNAYSNPISVLLGPVATHYRIEQSVCWVIPAERAAGTYQLWYVPRFAPLALSDTLPDDMSTQAWCEYAVVDAGIKVQQKQDLDPSVFAGQKAELRARIVSAASTRDDGPPRRMVDTRGVSHHHGRGRFGWGV